MVFIVIGYILGGLIIAYVCNKMYTPTEEILIALVFIAWPLLAIGGVFWLVGDILFWLFNHIP